MCPVGGGRRLQGEGKGHAQPWRVQVCGQGSAGDVDVP